MKLLKAISEVISRKLILEISEKRILELINKYQNEKPNLTQNVIRTYIDRFEQIKNSPQITQKDIYQLSWMDLEKIIDASQKKDIKAGKMDVSIPDENLLYDKNNIRVYKAPNRKSCIRYGGGYNFCISARGDDNMYDSYRESGSPYFVFFDDLPKNDPNHLLVVIRYNDDFEDYRYTVTNTLNQGDEEFESKDELISSYPQLGSVVDLFTVIEREPKEHLIWKINKTYDDLRTKLYNNFFKSHIINDEQEYKEFATRSMIDNIEFLDGLDKFLSGELNLIYVSYELGWFGKNRQFSTKLNSLSEIKDFVYKKFIIPDIKTYEIEEPMTEDEFKDKMKVYKLEPNKFSPIETFYMKAAHKLHKTYKSDMNKISMGLYDDLELPKISINDLVK
jgi:hypothetical protein